MAALAIHDAHAQTINACVAKKQACVARKMAGLLKCHQKAESTGTSVDPACVQKVQDKFTGGAVPANGCFAKLEAKFPGGCLTANDTAALEATIDSFVTDAVTALDPGYPTPVSNACSAGKKKCVSKEAKALLTCHAKAARTGTIDPACVQKAHDRFTGGAVPANGCFAKLEARFSGGCLTTGDTPVLGTTVDTFVENAACALDATTPRCPCPSTYAFTGASTGIDQDLGWTGLAHDQPLTSNVRLTLAISRCPNPVEPCGTCNLAGPIANGAGSIASQRCRGDSTGANGSWLQCTSDAECAGAGNVCVYFLGPWQPVGDGGVSFCTSYEIASPVSGTVDPATGATSFGLGLRWNSYSGSSVSTPCPICVGDVAANDGLQQGTCSSGARAGAVCDVNGTSALMDDAVSLDCPPPSGARLTSPYPNNPVWAMTLGTGVQTATLSPASPACRAVGFGADRCFCDTCNDAATTPCMSDADCVAAGATTCGGKRCVAGANAGTPCTAASECPGGGCSVPGTATAPNQCDDTICTSNTPPDNSSANEGVCLAGPMESYCTLNAFRACGTDADCSFDIPGDTCAAPKPRECFTDNGTLGGTVTVAGVVSRTSPTLGGLFCTPPVFNATTGSGVALINNSYGDPGLGRLTIPGTAVMN
jgi:hypothetical protein